VIAVIDWSQGDDVPTQLQFIGPSGELLQVVVPEDELPDKGVRSEVDLESWSPDGSIFWGTHSLTWVPQHLFTILIETWEINTYDVSALPIQTDYSFNPMTNQLVYSDSPAFINMGGFTRFSIEQTPVNLYLVDLQSGDQDQLAVSIARRFAPEWISDFEIAYNDPVGRGRITLDLRDQSTVLERKAPENTIIVYPSQIPQEFESVMETLQNTDTGIMLPVSFPVEEGSPAVFPDIFRAESGTYWIHLELGDDCQSGQNCYYGSLGARRFGVGGGSEASIMPFWGREMFSYISLSNRITGYLVQPSCSTCASTEIYWIFDKTEYKLTIIGSDEDDLITVANAMIENSFPIEEGN
jgi:hypothetical protein